MIKIKNSPLSNKEKLEIKALFSEMYDPYCDFYITKNNLRLFIRENPEILFEGAAKGDYIAYDEHGLATIIGFSDKSERKYLRFLIRDLWRLEELLTTLNFKYKGELYTKLKSGNPGISVLLSRGFKIIAGRGEEVLLKKD